MNRFKPYLQFLRPVLGALIISILAGAVYGGSTGFLIPKIIHYGYPKVFGEGYNPSLGMIILIGMLMILISLVRSVSYFVNGYYLAYCGQHVLEQIRLLTFGKMQRLPISYFHHRSPGDLITRVTGDTLILQTVLTEFAQEVFRQPATLIATLAAVITVCLQRADVAFLIILLAAIPLTIVPVRIIGVKLRERARAQQDQGGIVATRLAQNLGAIREIRAFGLETHEMKRYGVACQEYLRRVLKSTKYTLFLSPAIEVIAAVGVCLAFGYAWHKSIPPEDVITILLALYLSYEPLKKLGRLHNRLKEASASLDRIEEIIHADETIHDPVTPLPFTHIQGEITFQNVSFAYDTEPVLNGVNLTLPAGKTYALVGPSGAGKSTFTQLIPRFYDVNTGAIFIDGKDIRSIKLSDLRQHIALVPQDPVLFNDTVYNNLLVGKLDATEEEVHAAARQAFAEEFILSLDQGYDTPLGENGVRLSGGQRQRLAIARAFLRQAPILIMDEATSALDTHSEAFIQQALEKLIHGRTVILIAHRFSSIRHADEVLVFDKGAITERGTHDTLMAKQGLYASLYTQQTSLPNT